MSWLLALAALALAALLYRAPAWLSAAGLMMGLVLALVLAGVGGVARAGGALVLALLAAALLAPQAGLAWRGAKVGPRRRPHATEADSEGVIAGYEFLEKVGSGGMASVYRARRLDDGIIVALKVPMEQYASDAKFLRRFHREAEVAQRLDHPNIVRTLEHGSAGDRHFMAMEFVDGRSLEALIAADELSVELSLKIMKPVVAALGHIHEAGIIHRDIKPGNIMILTGALQDGALDPAGVKLMDFGIAGGRVLSRLTMSGGRVGTPVYMSPEQARGLRTDTESDVYSLGLVFYEMLTGQTAFRGSYEAIVHQQIFQTPPPPRQLNLQVPKLVDALVMQMIDKEAANRPKLSEVLAALEGPELLEPAASALASCLVVAVGARQGVLRVFDTAGTLQHTLLDIGVAAGKLAAAPTAIASDGRGHLYLAVTDHRMGGGKHATIHVFEAGGDKLGSFGPHGAGEGELLKPVALAVDDSGHVFVLDAGAQRVQVYSEGGFVGGFGGRGPGKGCFRDARALALEPSGAVLVLDVGTNQVQRFSAGGSYLSRWAFKLSSDQKALRPLDGLAVDAAGNVYIGDAAARKIRRIEAGGTLGAAYAVSPLQGEAVDGLLDLGVDDSGYLYAARRGGHLIRKYDPAGRLVATLETYAPLLQMLVDIRR